MDSYHQRWSRSCEVDSVFGRQVKNLRHQRLIKEAMPAHASSPSFSACIPIFHRGLFTAVEPSLPQFHYTTRFRVSLANSRALMSLDSSG